MILVFTQESSSKIKIKRVRINYYYLIFFIIFRQFFFFIILSWVVGVWKRQEKAPKKACVTTHSLPSEGDKTKSECEFEPGSSSQRASLHYYYCSTIILLFPPRRLTVSLLCLSLWILLLCQSKTLPKTERT